MKKVDVVVLYSASMAKSSGDSSYLGELPFSVDSDYSYFNRSYGYLLKKFNDMGKLAVFCTSVDIDDEGFSCYWIFDGEKWVKCKEKIKTSVVLTRFVPKNKLMTQKNRKMYSNSEICVFPFNDLRVFEGFQDKLCTYDQYQNLAIPTVSVDENSIEGINNSIRMLDDLCDSTDDFDKNRLILKDRVGSGGRGIYVFDKNDIGNVFDKIEDINLRYVLQPLVVCDEGFGELEIGKSVDLRIVIIGNEIVNVYSRSPKSGSLLSNVQQGGLLTCLSVDDLPQYVLRVVENITKKIDSRYALYSLDFIQSNKGKVFLVEGNNMPGINWYDDESERVKKKFIDLIVDKISLLV